MTLTERLDAAHLASVRVYQRKTELAQSAQQLQQQMAHCDAEFLRLDGEIRVLTALVEDAHHGK